MKRFRQAAVSYARKRARTFATAVGKRVVRSVKKRISRRISKMQSKSITAFRSLGGKLRMDNSIRSSEQSQGAVSNQLYTYEVTNIPEGTSNTSRESNTIMLKGFSYNFVFSNTNTDYAYLNFACITPKSYGGDLSSLASFFRLNNGTTNESFNSSTLTALSKYDRPINADEYIIHFRKKVILGGVLNNDTGTPTGNFDGNSRSVKHFKGYKSIKSRVSYTDQGIPTGQVADYKIYLVWWFNRLNDDLPLSGDLSVKWDRDVQVVFNGE